MLDSVLEKSYDVIGVVQDGRQLLAEAASCSRGRCCQGNRTGRVSARKSVIGGLAAADPLPQRLEGEAHAFVQDFAAKLRFAGLALGKIMGNSQKVVPLRCRVNFI